MPASTMTDTGLLDRRCPMQDGRATVAEWYSPVALRDNEHLERWCEVIGPPVVDSVPSAEFGDLQSEQPFALAVWNTDAGAGDVIAFLESEIGLVCAGGASTRRDSAPHMVLVLQEALRRSPALGTVAESWSTPPPVEEEERPGRRLDVVEVARRCGLAVFYVPAARNGHERRDGRGEDKGNAILSTLPLSEFVVIELPFESARRVVAGATVRGSSGNGLRVLGAHLITTPQAWRVLTTANSGRLRQAAAIISVLDSLEHRRPRREGSSGGLSTVLGGDLNTWSTKESALRYLLRYFPESPRPLMDRTRGPFPTDHVLFRRDHQRGTAEIVPGSYRRVEDRFYSDHHPIVVHFRLERDPSRQVNSRRPVERHQPHDDLPNSIVARPWR